MNNYAVAFEETAEFDAGPLTWVKAEIDQSLDRGLAALGQYCQNRGDATQLKHARTHVHQAAGAIQMVGLDAVAVYTDEIERSLGAIENAGDEAVPVVSAAIERACRRLKLYLDELVNGSPPVPLKLLADFEAMQKSRGVATTSPVDLFFPDLSVRPPKGAATREPEPQNLPSFLVHQRRLYQRGLLGWLRGQAQGLGDMRAAVNAIELSQSGREQRSFWWTATGFLAALANGALEPGFSAKQLCARVDLQIRRFIEGSNKVADRLRREVLYHVAIARAGDAVVDELKTAFRLGALIPSAGSGDSDLINLQPALREAREQLAAAKESWLKLASGRVDALPKLKQHLSELVARASTIGQPDLTRLVTALGQRLEHMKVDAIPEDMALEYATGMLLAESAIDNFSQLSPEFGRNVDAMILRLESGGVGLDEAPPLLDEMARRAQERLLMAQVGREIQTNLRHIEGVLDAFFRDHEKRSDLATLANYTKQIQGALRILGLDKAERLLLLCQEQIDAYAKPGAPVRDDDLEMLAESLSGLGFYVEAVEQQRPDRERLIEPFLRKRLGVVDEVKPVEDTSLEATLGDRRAALPALVGKLVANPGDAGHKVALREHLTAIRHDAELTGNTTLGEQASGALALLDDASESGRSALTATVEAMAKSATEPAPGPSDETMRLVSVSKEKLDAELLDIYLTEATEVLSTIADQYDRLRAASEDKEAMRIVRRGFHTLKGSGRMVGLTELGELAYSVEKVQNRWLEEDRAGSPAMLALIDVARAAFQGWVDGLRTEGSVLVDSSALDAAVARVEAEFAPREPTPPKGGGGGGGGSGRSPENANVVPFPRGGSERPAGMTVSELSGFDDGSGEVESVLATDEDFDDGEYDFDGGQDESYDPGGPVAVSIGEVTLSTALHQILCEEALQHIGTLRSELEVLQFDPGHSPSDEMVRASHTLRGIHRTSGFGLVADTSSALEQCLIALQNSTSPISDSEFGALAGAIEAIAGQLQRIRDAEPFEDSDEARAAEAGGQLELLRKRHATMPAQPSAAKSMQPEPSMIAELPANAEPPPTVAEPPPAMEFAGRSGSSLSAAGVGRESADLAWDPDANAAGEPIVVSGRDPLADLIDLEREIPRLDPVELETIPDGFGGPAFSAEADPVLAGIESEFAGRSAPADSDSVSPRAGGAVFQPVAAQIGQDPLAGVTDEVDADLMPIFLEEAAELFPQSAEQLRAWRADPTDNDSANRLRRTLHTFKGSARMAGANRLGELTHLMESRLVVGDEMVRPDADLFEALETDLDRVSMVLEGLQRGEFDMPLSWGAPADVIAQGTAVDVHAVSAPATAVGSAPAADALDAPESSTTIGAAPAGALRAQTDGHAETLSGLGFDFPDAPPSPEPARLAAGVAIVKSRELPTIAASRAEFMGDDATPPVATRTEAPDDEWIGVACTEEDRRLPAAGDPFLTPWSAEGEATGRGAAPHAGVASGSAGVPPSPGRSGAASDAAGASRHSARADSTDIDDVRAVLDLASTRTVQPPPAAPLSVSPGAGTPSGLTPNAVSPTAQMPVVTTAAQVPLAVTRVPERAAGAPSDSPAPGAPMASAFALEGSGVAGGVPWRPAIESLAAYSAPHAGMPSTGAPGAESGRHSGANAQAPAPTAGADSPVGSDAADLRGTPATVPADPEIVAFSAGAAASIDTEPVAGVVPTGTPAVTEPVATAGVPRATVPVESIEPAPATAAPSAVASQAPTDSAAVPVPSLPSATVVPLTAGGQSTFVASLAATPGRNETAKEAPPATDVEQSPRAMLRVRADLIDRLVNEAGEVSIARARVEGELRSLKANLLELTNSVIRLRNQVREVEIHAETQIQSRLSQVNETATTFDPLEFDRYTRFQELTRSLAEGINDISTVQQALLKNLDDGEAALIAQARLSREVQQQLFGIRTVPFGSLSERLYRIVRQTARELDRRVALEMRGGHVELDRSVLDKLVGPLEHLLRNAIDHGLESPAARAASGKPETGAITLGARQQGNEVVIELSDDGAGIDFERVKRRAGELGLLPEGVVPTEAQLVEIMFSAGFSTAREVTRISGRGIGLDVVRSDIAALGGRVEVTSQKGVGTRFTLVLPLTLAVAQAVLVRIGGRLFAIPSPMVEQVQQVKAENLQSLYSTRRVLWQGRPYPFYYLARLLGDEENNPETRRYNAVMLLKSGANLVAIHVDEMIGNQEVVVKNIGPQLARVIGIAGATVLGNGEVVLIINPVQLALRYETASLAEHRAAAAMPSVPGAGQHAERVLVVDDSLTVRKITSRFLAREGFDVDTARDGIDALQKVTEYRPDIILLDIEMPRMDGFEFAKTMRSDPKARHIPIIMITSRTAEKHRQMAADLGVDHYLGKPYQEEELLVSMRRLLQPSTATS